MLSDSNARLTAARRLTTRRARTESGRFLAEGAQSVAEALRRPGAVIEVFASAEARDRYDWIADLTTAAGDVPLDVISDKAAAALSDTVTPPGLVAVCRSLDVSLGQVLESGPSLIAALVEANDPGNAGTVLRSADAAGADALVLCGGVDLYNPKAVRASAGSLFHLPVVVGADADDLLKRAAAAGINRLATTGGAERELPALIADGTLQRPTLWLFGSEAHGLPNAVLEKADEQVRVPIYGQAESLNLAAAAAVCLYASALAQHTD